MFSAKTIQKKDDESNEIYLQRIEYISNKIKNSKLSLDEIINLSYVWRNHVFYHMIYPKALIKKL